ncbi:MAG TPA: DcaP family trimeric outer membrane transporter [Chryseolinea sp.]|nr:DcaP family trimeric outer membrane transporter [Chryseolinea sp.]HPH47716.1 DcaP family trimeric outer membrane transporter [Chryseolinea sp.]HPM32417.1 DcaP family trimeric outer membrane transporter [Chryseolinea sp.]
MKHLKFSALLLSLFISRITNAQSPPEETQFTIYGFGRASFVWDDQNLGRTDLFVPANINVGATKNPSFFIGAKQTRIGFDVKHTLAGETLSIKIEGDFHNDASDANGLFRMRHAYANYKFVLVGMTWSNFFDEEVNPTTVDFEGPNSSTLSRTPQIRFSTYKSKNVFSISLENPIENITVGGPITVLPERFPDVIAAYRLNGEFGFVKAAALLRELRYESDEARSLVAYGITVMTGIKVGEKDKLKFQGVMGTGVARYIQGASGLNYDAIYNGTNELEALQMHGSNISYQHFWKDHMHSSLTGGLLSVEDNSNLGNNNYKSGYYGAVNFLWDVVKNLTFGGEILVGERVNSDENKGNAVRMQMNATYKFNKSIN